LKLVTCTVTTALYYAAAHGRLPDDLPLELSEMVHVT